MGTLHSSPATRAASTRPAPRRAAADRASARSTGFTLLELLVVMALIGVLMGMGVGFLRRKGDEFSVALSTVRDQLRIAALTARTRHLPSEVVIDPGQDAPATVRARVLEPVGGWHMEEDAGADDDAGLEFEVGGAAEPGRFGMARRPDLDSRRPLLRVACGGSPVFDLRSGFALRVDLKLDGRGESVVARIGAGNFELRLDDEARPSAKIVTTSGGGRQDLTVTVADARALSLGRWHTLQVVHDGRDVRLLVDDREADRSSVAQPLLQTDRDVFEISPGDLPVDGLIDEVRMMAYSFAEQQSLPPGMRIAAEPWVIGFDREGDLVSTARFVLAIDDDRREFRVGPGGIVE